MDNLWRISGYGWDTLWLCQQFAMENGYWNSEFAHEIGWFSIAMLNYQRVEGLQWRKIDLMDDCTLNWKIHPNCGQNILHQFVTGWWFEPLWKILVNWDDDIPNIWKNKKCSKPPTSNVCRQRVNTSQIWYGDVSCAVHAIYHEQCELWVTQGIRPNKSRNHLSRTNTYQL